MSGSVQWLGIKIGEALFIEGLTYTKSLVELV